MSLIEQCSFFYTRLKLSTSPVLFIVTMRTLILHREKLHVLLRSPVTELSAEKEHNIEVITWDKENVGVPIIEVFFCCHY